jgi:hypothetical protein
MCVTEAESSNGFLTSTGRRTHDRLWVLVATTWVLLPFGFHNQQNFIDDIIRPHMCPRASTSAAQGTSDGAASLIFNLSYSSVSLPFTALSYDIL